MMYSVYKNALLNISADDSVDARWGCFRDRDPLSVSPMRLRLPGLEDWDYWLTPDSDAVFEAVGRAPLAKRSWVFQERQLSRRLLHFTSRELVWECCATGSYFACETFPDGAPFKSVFNNRPKFQSQSNLENSSPAELYKAWGTLCQSYSEKKLSHNSDKAVALSGLAQEFQAACPSDTYISGLWVSGLPNSLLWKSSPDSGLLETDGYIAPTWSWLAIDGSISYHEPSDTEHSLVDITRVAMTPALLSEPTASLRSASLHLRCYLRPIEIQPDYEKKPWYMMAMGGGKKHKLIIKDGGRELLHGPYTKFHFSFDVPSDEESGPTTVTGFFLPLCIEQPTTSFECIIRGLLVEAVGDDLTTFRRIGVMGVEGSQCLPIKYRLKDHQDNGENSVEEDVNLWKSLDDLLKPSYKRLRSLKQDMDGKKETEGSAYSSAALGSNRQATDPGDYNDGEAEGESVASIRANEAQIGATETEKEDVGVETPESKGKEKEILGAKLDINKENQDSEENPQPTVDLSTIDSLERMYALDTAFMASELVAHFEWLVPQQITLV